MTNNYPKKLTFFINAPQQLTSTQNNPQQSTTLRKKRRYLEFSWSVFSHIWTESGDLIHKSLHSVQMRENTDLKTLNRTLFKKYKV